MAARSDPLQAARPGAGPGWRGWIARADVQALVARLPLLRHLARRDGAEIFDLVQGFVTAQALAALVELGLLQRLLQAPETPEALARDTGLEPRRMALLLRAGQAMRLLRRRRDGRYALARRGAAILGVPGLTEMIAHHRAFYADMADPVALLRGRGETELAQLWPYVLGGGVDPEAAQRYSALMAQSQALVAQDTLATVSLRGVTRLMDVGGGSGAFLAAALQRHPGLSARLVDLPAVLEGAEARLRPWCDAGRLQLCPQDFRAGPLPAGADAISLIRVLYDHPDAVVRPLLRRCFEALPPRGRLIISEPMSGGAARPDRATDLYFAFYTLAMGSGEARSQARIAALCAEAGFVGIRRPRVFRPYVTGVVTAMRGR